MTGFRAAHRRRVVDAGWPVGAARRLGRLALLALSCLAFAGTASATPITMTFTGTINLVDSGLTSAFAAGDTVTATLTFDTAAPDLSSNTFFGLYDTAISAFSVTTSGGYSASATKGQIEITATAVADTFRARAFSTGVAPDYGLTGADVNGYDLLGFSVRLNDSTGAALQNDGLFTSIDLSAFDTTSIGFDFGRTTYGGGIGDSGQGFLAVRATLTSAEVTTAPVPEPASLTLLASGLAAVAARARQRRRNRL